MTPQDQEARDRLDELAAAADEAALDRDRHRREAAVLATLARAGPGTPFAAAFSDAWTQEAFAFTRAELRACATALYRQICLDGVVADPVLLRDKLLEDPVAVSDATLNGILDGSQAVDPVVATQYMRALAGMDKQRRALDFAQAFKTKVENLQPGGDPDAAFAELCRDFFELAHGRGLAGARQNENVATPPFLDELKKRRDDGRPWTGLDSGFHHLNEVLNGLDAGVFVLAGAPSTGKTTLAVQIAAHVAEKEAVPVRFWSFEQSAEELRVKSLARIASLDSRVIRKGRAGEPETWNKIEEAAATYRRHTGHHLTIIEGGAQHTVDTIRADALLALHAARAQGQDRICVAIDYLQIVPAGAEAETVRERVDFVLSELRRLARDLRSPILVISSENRAAYGGNPKPSLTALKESGGIEYSADAVICLWRDKEETAKLVKDRAKQRAQGQDAPQAIRVAAFVLKNRNGELAKIKLDFTPAWARFDEGDREDLSWDVALSEK